MIAKCESCRTAFDIPDHLIKENGTKFRCPKCSHIFKVFPPAPEPASPSPPAAVPQPAIPSDSQADNGKKEKSGSSVSFSEKASMTTVNFSEEAFGVRSQKEDRYVDLGVIGEGGMGEVRLAKDTQLLRKVAVKALKKEAATPAALSYFLREAQITAQLDHPNIVPIYTVKQPEKGEQNVSFVMKLIKGKTLSDVIRKARKEAYKNPKAELPPELDLDTRLEYFLKACDGMIYAHRKEVVHRDIKPSNIMIGDYGEVYVMDWGIAKMVKEIPETLYGIQRVAARKSKSDLYVGGTEMGSVVGTPGYISPEQVKGLPDVGPASDQFSLGVILYELVTLKPARPGDMMQKLKWAEEGYINQIAYAVADRKIAPELEAIIHKATALDPKDRYPSVSHMADDIRRFLKGEEVSELPDNFFQRVWRWMNRHRHVTAITMLSILLILSCVTIWSLRREKANLNASRMREKKLTHLLTKVATQAHYINSRFIRLEDLLVGLANNAMYLIQNPVTGDERLYWRDDFWDEKTAPPDLASSPLYHQEVSIDYPVAKLAPGVKMEDVLPMMQRLAALRYHFKKMLLDSRGNFAPLSEEEARRLLTIHGLPVSWIYIGLEAGVMYSYPGKGNYKDEYDPRKRPWYELSAHRTDVRWGNPYIDNQGLGRVLPCSASLYDRNGKFYGVIGIDVTYTNIIQDSLTRKDAVGVVESFLLNEEGKIVVRSSESGIVSEPETGGALNLEFFPVQEVVKKIERRESGLIEVRRDGENRIIFFHQIPALNWYYVEDVRTSVIFFGTER